MCLLGLLDVSMKGLDGYEVLVEVCELFIRPNTSFMSGEQNFFSRELLKLYVGRLTTRFETETPHTGTVDVSPDVFP